MSNALAWVSALVPLAATIIGGWLGHRILSPKDHERAALLETIAEGAAALVVSLNPNKPWAELLADVVARISAAAGVPTKSNAAIQQAAAAALNKSLAQLQAARSALLPPAKAGGAS